jgi:hypothetical protein
MQPVRHNFMSPDNGKVNSQGSTGVLRSSAYDLGSSFDLVDSKRQHNSSTVNTRFGASCNGDQSSGYLQSLNPSLSNNPVATGDSASGGCTDSVTEAFRNSKTPGVFGRFSANPEHAKRFASDPTPNISLSMDMRSNNLVPLFQNPAATGGGPNVGQRRSSIGSSGQRHPAVANENIYHNGMNENPKSCWQHKPTGVWYCKIAESTRSGSRVEISPATSYKAESSFDVIVVPAVDEVYFARDTELREVALDRTYDPKGAIFSYLAKSDLIRIFGTSEPEPDGSKAWSKAFYVLEQILPKPPRSASEIASFRIQGQITDPYLAMVISCNSWPQDLIDKIKGIIHHFSERSKKMREQGSSTDDERFIEYCMRRAEKARVFIGSSTNCWMSQPHLVKFARCAQTSHFRLTTKMFCDVFPDAERDNQRTEWCKVLSYILGLCSWDRVESVNRDIRRACSGAHSPQNALHSFIDIMISFIELNPMLDDSHAPVNSRGSPLSLGVTRMRPDQPCLCLNGSDFPSYLATHLRSVSRDVAFEYNQAKKHEVEVKEQKKNPANNQGQQAQNALQTQGFSKLIKTLNRSISFNGKAQNRKGNQGLNKQDVQRMIKQCVGNLGNDGSDNGNKANNLTANPKGPKKKKKTAVKKS